MPSRAVPPPAFDWRRLPACDGWRTGLVLAVVALLVQAVFLAETVRSLLFRYPLVDALAYYRQAVALAASQPSAPGAFWQPPLYPFLLSGLVRLFGPDPVVLRAVQALLLAPLTTLLAWRVARRVAPPAWAFGSAIAVTLCGPLFFYQSHLLAVAPAAALFTGALLLGLRALERPTFGRWLLAGLCTGLAALAVGTCGALLPVLMLFALFAAPMWRRRVLHAAAPLAGVLLILAPVALRNHEASGRWVWISTNDGINLFIGNNRNWEVTLTAQPGLDWDKLARLPRQQGNALNAVDGDFYFRRLAWQEARQNPAALARLARKAVVFWHGREIPRNLDIYGWRETSRLLQLSVWRAGWLCFPTGLLAPLALAGAVILVRRRDGGLLVCGALAFGLLVALYFPCSRYRVPVLPVLVIAAAAGAHALAQAITQALAQRRWSWTAALVALMLAAGAAANAPLAWPTDRICYPAHLWNAIGAAADGHRDLETAASCYAAALRLDPSFADARFNQGTLFARQKEPDRAAADYRAAIAARPDHDKARINLALHLAERGDLDAAYEQLKMAETVNPLNAEAFYNHAALKLRAGRGQEALLLLGRAAFLDSSRLPEYRALERALAQEQPAR